MTKTGRKICVVTGSRAEYGQLYWLMKAIDDDPALALQVVVTGSHLMDEFGKTVGAIEADGIRIDRRVEMPLGQDTVVEVTKALGQATCGFADAFAELKPELIVLLGDRYELLAAAEAAMIARIPIAHIHGGELTEGLIDEAIRHSITKMSHYHFVASKVYGRRVVQLGEDPQRVFVYGTPGLDNLVKLPLLSRTALEKELGFRLGKPAFLVTYHPLTLSAVPSAEGTKSLCRALDHFENARIVFTKSNADPQGISINREIDQYVKRKNCSAAVFASLGQLKYLSLMKEVDVVIGNSSSGVIEAPSFNKATVNIGDRQRGRLKAKSVIDSGESEPEIVAAIEKALSPGFQRSLRKVISPYGRGGNISERIKERLKQVKLNGVLMKRFYDLPVSS